MTAIEKTVFLRIVFLLLMIVATGIVAVLVLFWARVSLDLVGSNPQKGLGHLVLWGVTLAFVAICAGIGNRLPRSGGLLSTCVGCITLLAALWMVELVFPMSSILIDPELLLGILLLIIGGGSAAAAGLCLRYGQLPYAIALMGLGAFVVWPLAWVILFFE